MLMSFDKNVSQLLEGWMGMNTVCTDDAHIPGTNYVSPLASLLRTFPLAIDLTNHK